MKQIVDLLLAKKIFINLHSRFKVTHVKGNADEFNIMLYSNIRSCLELLSIQLKLQIHTQSYLVAT